MLRSLARRRSSLLLGSLLAGSLLLAACGGGSGGSSDGADAETTTTTKAEGGETTTTAAPEKRPAYIEDFAAVLEGSGFDDEQIDCILKVAEEGFGSGADAAKLDEAYSEECGLTGPQVTAGAYYSALLDLGVEEEAAACARDLYGNLTVEQAQVFQTDTGARDSLLEGCNIDPAVVATEG